MWLTFSVKGSKIKGSLFFHGKFSQKQSKESLNNRLNYFDKILPLFEQKFRQTATSKILQIELKVFLEILESFHQNSIKLHPKKLKFLQWHDKMLLAKVAGTAMLIRNGKLQTFIRCPSKGSTS